MNEGVKQYAEAVPCPEGCRVEYLKSNRGLYVKKGVDYDCYFFQVVDRDGAVVDYFEVRDGVSTYPPFDKTGIEAFRVDKGRVDSA